MVTQDSSNEEEIISSEPEEEEVVVETTSSPSRSQNDSSEYDAVWEPEDINQTWPPEVSEFNIIGYNSEGTSVGPFKVMAPTLDKACALVDIDRSRGPVQIVE
jgi:hypothetical protein